jgi:RNA polymerase sigma-70 factor (ECF subfamily)
VSPKPDFGDLFERYNGEIYAYLWRLFRGDAEAEDCLQEVFLRAFRAYGRLDGDANVRAWLYKIATNTAASFLKKRTRARSRETVVEIETVQGTSSVQRAVELREAVEALAHAVEDLPPQQRSALILRKYQELPYAEIALALECTKDAARANVYQALRKLRARFHGSLLG